MKTLVLVFALILSALVVIGEKGYAQAPPTPTVNDDLGLTWYASYHGGDIDNISLSNGALTLHIPVISYPQRGGQLGVSFSIDHNAKAMQVFNVCDPLTGCSTQWSFSVAQGVNPIGPSWAHDQDVAVVDTLAIANKIVADYASLRFADGSTHYMGQTGGIFGEQQSTYHGFVVSNMKREMGPGTNW
jgi:hypothetical protein